LNWSTPGPLELAHADEVFVGCAKDAEAIDESSVTNSALRAADLGVVVVVVALARPDIRRELLGRSSRGVLVDEVDDVVAHQAGNQRVRSRPSA
jgi:hypothetical protein